MYEVQMKKILSILFLLMVISCQQADWREDVKSQLFKIDNFVLNTSYLNKGNMRSPLNTWLEVLSFKKDRKIHCLFYKTPFGDKKGVLKITSVKKGKCDPFAEGNVLTDKLVDFSFNYVSGAHVEKSNILEFLVVEKKAVEKLEIPLLNYEAAKKYQRYDNQLNDSFVDDVAFGVSTEVSKLENGQLCHGVNSDCRSVVEYKCDRCVEGVVEVIDYNCPQGGSKYCGRNDCGKKNQPACPRGYKILDSKLASLCFDGSPAGFCEPGLKTFCNEKNILVCL
jgi:hypothetical protein